MKETKIRLTAVLSSVAVLMILFLMLSANAKNNPSLNNPDNTEAMPDVEITDELLLLVNYKNAMPSDYKLDLVDTENKMQIDRRAAEPLKQMLNDCRKAGYNPYLRSAYRSIETQTALYNRKVNSYKNQGLKQKEAEQKASMWVAYPGKSEHNLGLAVDIVDQNYQQLDESQEKRDTQKWLMQNCWKYGFILRYPTNKKSITHINYEPWHYRYVGKENAKMIKNSGLCLEEYLGKE